MDRGAVTQFGQPSIIEEDLCGLSFYTVLLSSSPLLSYVVLL